MMDLKMYMNGEWKKSCNGDKDDAINPATQELIAKAPRATKEETDFSGPLNKPLKIMIGLLY
jgi:betaine-aldehyde dehydrogenase